MPFNRPAPTDILQRLMAEVDIELPGADARLRRTVENVLVKVVTMASHELHGYLDWIARQILPDTADASELERHASIWKVTRKSATPAQGPIIFTGQNDTVIPAGTFLQRADGVQYTLDADVTIDAGTGSGIVTAVVTGIEGVAPANTKLNPLTPLVGLNANALVGAGGLTGGFDIESDDNLRARVLERIQLPPHGGAAHDYIAWAKEVAGVTRAWVYPEQMGAGTVVVLFVMDDKPDTIIPSVGEIEDVQAYIDNVRPVTADVTVTAPTPVTVDLEIHINPNTQAVKDAIAAELTDFFRREAYPGGALYLSRINEAISTAAGEFDHVLVTPSANVSRSFGEVSVLGDITWDGL